MKSGQLGVAAVTALAPVIWGSTYLVTTEWLPPDRPLLATTVRTLPAGLMLLAVGRTLPTGTWFWRVLALGTLNIGAFNFLLFVAAYRLPGGIAAMLMGVQPMIVLVLAALLMRDKIRVAHVAACVLGAGGVSLLVFQGSGSLDAVGVAAALGASVCLAVGITLTKFWGRPDGVGLLTGTGWQLTAGGLVTLPFALGVEGLPGSVSGENVAGFSYLIVLGAVVSYVIWFRGIEKLPALAVSVLAFGSPISAAVLGFVVLDQTLSAPQLVGIAVIIGSALLAQPRPARPDAPSSGPTTTMEGSGMPSTTATPRTLAVIGTGEVGQAIGRLWLEAGHEVVFGSRTPDRRAQDLAGLGDPGEPGGPRGRAKVLSQAEAMAAADVVLLALPGEAVEARAGELAAALAGKVVIDATNQIDFTGGRVLSALEPGITEGRWMAARLPRSTVVRAYSHVPKELLHKKGSREAGFWAMAVAGDDPEARSMVAGLVRDSGWTPVDLGGLDDSAALDPGGALFHLLYTSTEMGDVLGAPVKVL